MSKEIEDLLAKKFISRTDVKAKQFANGAWAPHREFNPATGKHDGERIPWRREDLGAHLSGRTTFGHYVVSANSECKLFAFDIDLEKAGSLPTLPLPSWENPEDPFNEAFNDGLAACDDLRGAWASRGHVARWYMKLQFKELAHKLCKAIVEELELPCAVSYSGSKGVHVYAFLPKLLPAHEAREGAKIVLDSVDSIKPSKGEHFFKSDFFPNLSIEVFPKQDSMEGKDLGNLLRLPLGKNLKSKDPTFFIDMCSPLGEMKPIAPELALSKANPWQ